MKSLLTVVFILMALIITAQKIYIPYRANSKWGLADTTGKITFVPQYDALEYDEFQNYSNNAMVFIAVKNKRRGILYNNKAVLNPVYEQVYINRYFFFCINGKDAEKNIYLHNFKGQLLNQKPYKDVSQFYHPYNNHEQTMFAAKLSDNNYNLVYIDTAGKLVTLLQNQFGISGNGNMIEVAKKAGVEKDLYSVLRSAKGVLSLQIQKPILTGDETIEYDQSKPVVEMGNEKTQAYRFIKNGTEWKSYSNYNINTLNFDWSQYDSVYVLKTDYNSINTKNQYGQYIKYENVLVTRKNGLYGLVFPDGKRISNSYMAVEYFRTTSGNNFLKYIDGVRFLVKKDGNYGIIGIDEQVIIPAKYDQITPDLIVKEGTVYGLLQTDGSWQLPLQYDTIAFERSKQQYQLTKNNKYGLFIFTTDNNKSILLDCTVPYPLKGWKRFRTNAPTYQSYIVYEAYSNEKFLGYYDRKGFGYFK